MVWMNRRDRIWRVTELALLLVAILGPWWFDVINVPAQYTCSGEFIRLDGDFCGTPISGAWMPMGVVAGVVPMVVNLLTGTTAFSEWIRDLALGVFILLPVLPIASTILLILASSSRRQVFHILALGLALCIALFILASMIGTARYSNVWGLLWGLELYIGVAASLLALELFTFIRKLVNLRPLSSNI